MSCNCENHIDVITPEKMEKIKEILGTENLIVVAQKGKSAEVKIEASGGLVSAAAVELINYTKSKSRDAYLKIMAEIV